MKILFYGDSFTLIYSDYTIYWNVTYGLNRAACPHHHQLVD